MKPGDIVFYFDDNVPKAAAVAAVNSRHEIRTVTNRYLSNDDRRLTLPGACEIEIARRNSSIDYFRREIKSYHETLKRLKREADELAAQATAADHGEFEARLRAEAKQLDDERRNQQPIYYSSPSSVLTWISLANDFNAQQPYIDPGPANRPNIQTEDRDPRLDVPAANIDF